MKRSKKAITLHSVKQLWKRMGIRPVEVPLITQNMIDEVTAKPRQSNPMPLNMPALSQPKQIASKPCYQLAWTMVAGVLLLIGVGTFWLTRTVGNEEQKQMTAQVKHTIGRDVGSNLPVMKELSLSDANKENTRSENPQFAKAFEKHQWQTAAKLSSSQVEEHGNEGIICYSKGHISDYCDEEMVTTMLLAFL